MDEGQLPGSSSSGYKVRTVFNTTSSHGENRGSQSFQLDGELQSYREKPKSCLSHTPTLLLNGTAS